MASENREKKPIVIERRRGKDRKKTPRLTKTYDVTIIPATVGIVAETEEPPKKRVAAYCRVSTDQEAQETSLEEQMAHFNTVIAEHPDWELAGIYTDEGISGTQVKHRVQFQQMIEDAKAKKIDLILTKSITDLKYQEIFTRKPVSRCWVMSMSEVRRSLDFLQGLYEISDDGRLFSCRSNKYLSPDRDRYGYVYYVVSINNVRMTLKAHRLVTYAFIPNPLNKPTINHKNGVRSDNRVENLEWATAKEQAADPLTRENNRRIQAQTDYRAMGSLRNFGRHKTAVYREESLLGIYDSLKEAASVHKKSYSKASECANGLRGEVGGLKFCFE